MGGGSDSGPLGTSVGTDELVALCVTAAKIAAAAVTRAKMSDPPDPDQNIAPQDIAITDSQWTSPTTCTSSSGGSSVQDVINNYQATNSAAWNGRVWVSKKITGLLAGSTFSAVILKVFTAAGNVRIKVYSDDGASGAPGTLLAQSGSLAVGGTGEQSFNLSAAATVPASGNVYVGFECDSAALDLYCTNTGVSGDSKSVVHTYGAGPDPFGAVSDFTTPIYVKISATVDIAAYMKDDKSNPTTNKLSTSSEVGPWIKGDFASAQIIAGVALHLHANTTATQLKLEVSADDATYTQVRKTDITLFTLGSWNLWYFNRRPTTIRYIKVTGTDAGAKVISCNEMAGLILSESAMNARQGNKGISSTDNTLTLGGD